MDYIEAHQIVHRYTAAASRNSGTLLIPYSWVENSDQELIDAFVIFFGHMVVWETRTNEEYQSYKNLIKNIYMIVPDSTYKVVVDAKEVLEKAQKSSIFRFGNRQLIENAKTAEKMEMQLISDGWDRNVARIERIDFGELVKLFQQYVGEFYKKYPDFTEEQFEDFLEDYVFYVYEFTSFKKPAEEDFPVFLSIEKMKEYAERYSEMTPLWKGVYEKYQNYILNMN